MAITDDHKQVLKETYLGDPYLSLKDLSEASESVCGVLVSLEALKIMSWAEGWGVEKKRIQLGKDGLPRDVQDEADDLRKIVYAQIMDPEARHGASELTTLIRAWEAIKTASPRRKSGKSSRDQQIEASRLALEKIKDLEERRKSARDNS